MREPGGIVVVSCYELGHQPLAAATTVAFLERAGFSPQAVDLAVDATGELERVLREREPCLVAISVPMHTALHVGVRAARRVRELAAEAHVCFYGLYALLNRDYLLDELGDSVIGGEFEVPLVALAEALAAGRDPSAIPGVGTGDRAEAPWLERLDFPTPAREALPSLGRYAHLEVDGNRHRAAAIETSRGCLHHCRHCPIPAVYGGRLFVVPQQVVLRDVERLVSEGVRHLTFADPDFFNGPRHSLRVVDAIHERFPQLTFDITTKIEHVLKHRDGFPRLTEQGCLFVVSAVESLSDRVLAELDKGHTRQDVFQALSILQDAGISLRPSWVAFTPWTELTDYLEILDWIEEAELVDQVDPVQLSIRLLVPPGSLLAERPSMRRHVTERDPDGFCWRWDHPDPRMDRLHSEVAALVHEATLREEDAARTFERIRHTALSVAGFSLPPPVRHALPSLDRRRPPRLTEPWFC